MDLLQGIVTAMSWRSLQHVHLPTNHKETLTRSTLDLEGSGWFGNLGAAGLGGHYCLKCLRPDASFAAWASLFE